jgi:hypothetical protein
VKPGDKIRGELLENPESRVTEVLRRLGVDYDESRGTIPSGWAGILEKLLVHLKRHGWPGELRLLQEREGGLRVDVGSEEPWALALVRVAEVLSFRTCSQCGAPGHRAWVECQVKTLCGPCEALTEPLCYNREHVHED